MRGPLFRVLMKRDKVAEVPEPPTNVQVVDLRNDDAVLAALDPDGVYDVEVHGL